MEPGSGVRRPRAVMPWVAAAALVVVVSIGATAPAATAPAATASAATAPAASPRPSTPPVEGPRSLPTDLVPPLDEARGIRPQAYTDGCHAKAGDTKARACAYGVEDGAYSVVLVGDSHAVQWLPALVDIANREGWRLYSLTKSACPVPRITVIVRGKPLRDCDRWRESAFDQIARLHPDLVIAASLGRIYEVPRGGTRKRRDRLWRDAWVDSLRELRGSSDEVVLLGDTPMWRTDPIDCLGDHPRDIDRCDTPRDQAVSKRTDRVESAAADRARVRFVATADLVCPGDPCRAVEGDSLVLVDTQHMTVAWARRIAPGLLGRLRCALPPDALASQGPSPSVGMGASPAPPPSAGAWPVPDTTSPTGLATSAPTDPTAGPGVSCP